MKATLIVNSRGVVTLPAKFRKALGIQADDAIIAEATPEGILLKPVVMMPVEMYSAARIAGFDRAEAELAQAMSTGKPKRPGPGRAKAVKVAKAPRRPR